MHAYSKDSIRLSGAVRICGNRVPARMSLSFLRLRQPVHLEAQAPTLSTAN